MFLFRFSEEQKAQLLIKYKTLTSVDEKFEFWLNELKQPFSNFNTFDYQEVIEFDIHAIGEQAIRINELVINQAKIRERGFNKKSILDYDELFYELQNKIENSKNPIFTISSVRLK